MLNLKSQFLSLAGPSHGGSSEDSSAAHRRIDLLKLARTGRVISGEIDLSTCERLADQLPEGFDEEPDEPAGTIAYRIIGGNDSQGWPTVTIVLSGVVPLVCQRCLEPFGYRLERETTVRLARSEEQLKAWDAEEIEAILAVAQVDRDELIEDELLLCVPYAPMHGLDECPGPAKEM